MNPLFLQDKILRGKLVPKAKNALPMFAQKGIIQLF